MFGLIARSLHRRPAFGMCSPILTTGSSGVPQSRQSSATTASFAVALTAVSKRWWAFGYPLSLATINPATIGAGKSAAYAPPDIGLSPWRRDAADSASMFLFSLRPMSLSAGWLWGELPNYWRHEALNMAAGIAAFMRLRLLVAQCIARVEVRGAARR